MEMKERYFQVSDVFDQLFDQGPLHPLCYMNSYFTNLYLKLDRNEHQSAILYTGKSCKGYLRVQLFLKKSEKDRITLRGKCESGKSVKVVITKTKEDRKREEGENTQKKPRWYVKVRVGFAFCLRVIY